ncbi:MAG TPA: phosphotransferase [Thermoleophilaceae bacterium]|jgi:trehalose synthase-fused probable maltokinase|nr:phosphotransferase [Thermoleophilaceae bacterium]
MTTQTEVRELAGRGDLSFLDPEVLQEWVVGQRWFGSKGRAVSSLDVLQGVPLRNDEPLLVLALIAARFPAGTHHLYQLPIGIRHSDEGWDRGVIAEVGNWTVYDGLTDPDLARELLRRMREESIARAGGSTLTFRWADGQVPRNGEVRPIGVEQSNSSMVFGDSLVLKSFRRLEPGVNPELELLRFLDGHGFENIAPLAGWYEYEGRLVESTLGILQEFLTAARDGWSLAVDEDGEDPERLIEQLEDLGRVTGRMHSVLGSDATDSAFAPEEPTDGALALITATVDEEIERIFKNLPADDEGPVAQIRGRSQDVRERLGQLSRIGVGGRTIRTHGDYHLGQVMLTQRGWVVLDFEGEPARPLPERRQKRSPLRDVAGMLRSFSYVAAAGDILGTRTMPEDWESRARAAFLEGYFRAVDPALLPPGQESIEKLLSVFELEKAVYELNYEINNRPDWVGIPVASILRLLEAE